MAIYQQAVTVSTTAVRLDPTTGGAIPRGTSTIRNEGSVTVYLGGSGVTTSTGWPLKAGEVYSDDLEAGDALYGITASGSAECRVLQTGAA